MSLTELYCHVLKYLAAKPEIIVRGSDLVETSGNKQPPFNYSGRIRYEGDLQPAALINGLSAGLEGIVEKRIGPWNLTLSRFSTPNGGEIVYIERMTPVEARKR